MPVRIAGGLPRNTQLMLNQHQMLDASFAVFCVYSYLTVTPHGGMLDSPLQHGQCMS